MTGGGGGNVSISNLYPSSIISALQYIFIFS